MSAGPFDITPVIARLKANVPELRLVGAAADLAAARESKAPVTPAAYVMLGSEVGDEVRGSSGAYIQMVTVTFGVAFALRNYRAAGLGTAQKDELVTVLAGARRCILNWSPIAGMGACELSSSKLNDYDVATVWWVETYRTYYEARSLEVLP